MPSTNIEVNKLIDMILAKSFESKEIDLRSQGVSDSDVHELMSAINSNLEVAESLASIDLQDNWLTVPPDVSRCSCLQFLILHNNKLSIPPNVSKCITLKGLGLKGNPLTDFGQRALDALRRKKLTIGWDAVDIIQKDTPEMLSQHLQSAYDIYLDIFKDKIVDQDIRQQIFELSHENLSILRSIFYDTSKLTQSEILNIEQFSSMLDEKLQDIFENCHYVVYQNAINMEPSNISIAKQLFLKAARLGNNAACSKVKEYMGEDLFKIFDIVKCPISLDIMINPVTVPSGHSYESVAIKEWIRNSKQFMDHTRQPLDFPEGSGNASLVPNQTLAGLIEYMLYNNGRFYGYNGFVNPTTGKFYNSVSLTLDGVTVESDPSNFYLRHDYVLNELLSYVKKYKNDSQPNQALLLG